MVDTAKFSTEELNQVAALRQELAVVSQQYGHLAFTKRMLEKEILQIELKYDALLKKEEALVKSLNDKYGTGTLNLETGEFTPSA